MTRREVPAAVILEVKRLRQLGRSPPRIAEALGLSLHTVQAILAGRVVLARKDN